MPKAKPPVQFKKPESYERPVSQTRDARFTATETFTCNETGNVYVEGMDYRIRKNNDILRTRVAQWLQNGKVLIIPADGVKAVIRGKGEVK